MKLYTNLTPYFLSITKAAAKLPDSGLIKIQEDLEGYIAEQGWG